MRRYSSAFFCLIVFGFACTASAQGPTLGNCPVLPADNIWNTPIDQLPVSPQSSTYVNTIGPSYIVHADFGQGSWDGELIGMPITTVPSTQTKYPASFTYASESDPGPYAVPLNAPIQGGSASTGDRHVISIDIDNCILYEMYSAYPQAASWQAVSGAIYNLFSNNLRPATWTSATAAGMAMYPGLVRYEEILAGEIRHAVEFTVPQTQQAYVWPARHFASPLTASQYPPMGARFRLRANFDISSFSPVNQIILRALKKYGMMIIDNGAPWFITGTNDDRWSNSDLHDLGRVHGSDFEAVDVSGLMISPDSGQARQTSAVSVTVTPSSASAQVSTTKQFSAVVNNSANQAVVWTASAGIISGTGLYTAPATVPSPATVTIQATSQADTSAKGTASVTITPPPPPVTVTVSPSSASVQVATTKQFSATVNNSSNQVVTWSVTGGGTISSSGLYTAPASVPSGPVTVQATSAASPSANGTATVTVTNPALPVTVTISPTSAEVRVNRTRVFTATVQDTTNKTVTWKVNGITGGNSTVGTISAQGNYQAPKSVPAGGTVQVSAVSVADPTQSASALVTVVRR